MPGIDRPPLAPHLEDIRAAIMALPRKERQRLMGALHGDISRSNDALHNEAADAADRARCAQNLMDPRGPSDAGRLGAEAAVDGS